MTQVIAVKLPDGSTFQVQDLPVSLLSEIATKNNVPWQVVIDAPISNIGVAVDVVRAVGIVADVEFPGMERVTGRDFIQTVADLFDLIEDEPAGDHLHYVAPSV